MTPEFPQEKAILIYTAILNQTGTNNPTAKILHNTTGSTITWTRDGTGNYIGTITRIIEQLKTALFITEQAASTKAVAGWNNTTSIYIYQTQLTSPFNPQDGLFNVIIELRIYNI